MTYKLFIDDTREPSDVTWVIVRSYDEAIAYIVSHGLPNFISFDHDLSDNSLTGYDIAKWIVESDLDGTINIPEDFTYEIHSQNPIGAANIKGLLDSYLSKKFS